MKNSFISAFVAGFLATVVVSECPNACSAHGKCGAYDMCTCYRNWMSNDCSERICQFGLAHVDTPKGDLDSSSGKLSDADHIVVSYNDMYPYGTTEQYPYVGDMDNVVLTNTAHEYRECSNKGMCDRGTGTCACFDGYDGAACQRASCPGSNGMMCSGHGTCQTIEEIANMDYGNIYELWDADATMGCNCDAGFSGADCSEKMCKWGADPLYFDSGATARYSNWTYMIYTGLAAPDTEVTGNYSIIFYDAHGEDWQTVPIDIDATCVTIIAALEGIPNNVIPPNTVRCFKTDLAVTMGNGPIQFSSWEIKKEVTLAFPGNPGKLRQIEITKYLDGTRPTLNSDEPTSTLGWHIYPNGYSGEDVDMVSDLCEDVQVTLLRDGNNNHVLDGISVQEAKALKRCLGSADSTDTNNIEVYNWDYGNIMNPHLIKLVDLTQYTTIEIEGGNAVAGTGYAHVSSSGYKTYDVNFDNNLAKVPVTPLCNPTKQDQNLYGVDASTTPQPLCSNANSPGFYSVLWYDSAYTNPFRLLTTPQTTSGTRYSTTTLFSVYTTKGYLQMVNPHSAVYSRMESYTTSQKNGNAYAQTLHVTNTSGTYANWYGWMDCETQQSGTSFLNGNLACLNKNDYVMFLGLNNSDANTPNIYQIKRLNRAEKNYGNSVKQSSAAFDGTPQQPWDYIINSDKIRTTITLDMSVNQDLLYNSGIFFGKTPSADDETIARAYKFYPDTSTSTGGYAWAGACSNRGICNSGTGLCECFHGYTNDNCDTINALAV